MLAQLREVTKRYVKTEGVRDLTLDIEEGQVLGVLGLNGSGKTTLLKLLAGLLFPRTLPAAHSIATRTAT